MANDTIQVAFGAGNTANADLLTLGTHTVQVTAGTNITDGASNQANTIPVWVTVSGTPSSSYVPRPSGTLGSPAILG